MHSRVLIGVLITVDVVAGNQPGPNPSRPTGSVLARLSLR